MVGGGAVLVGGSRDAWRRAIGFDVAVDVDVDVDVDGSRDVSSTAALVATTRRQRSAAASCSSGNGCWLAMRVRVGRFRPACSAASRLAAVCGQAGSVVIRRSTAVAQSCHRLVAASAEPRGASMQCQRHRRRRDPASVEPVGEGQDAAFGIEDGGGAVAGGAGDLIDRGAVRAPQNRRLPQLRAGGQRHRQSGRQDPRDDRVDDPVELVDAKVRHGVMAAHLSLGLGADVIDLPRRPVVLQCGEHGPRKRIDLQRSAHGPGRRVQRLTYEAVHGLFTAQHGGGVGAPGPALVGQRARGVLAFAGGQRGLLGQVLALDGGRRPAVVGLELRPQLRQDGLDVGPSR